MNKRIVLIIIIVIICVGGLFILKDVFNTPTNYVPLTEITNDFIFDEADLVWNETSKKLKHTQKIRTPSNMSYEKIGIKTLFYKGSKYIGYNYNSAENIDNGEFYLNFTVKLPEEPTKCYYEVVKVVES